MSTGKGLRSVRNLLSSLLNIIGLQLVLVVYDGIVSRTYGSLKVGKSYAQRIVISPT